jgi:hypothetical protein
MNAPRHFEVLDGRRYAADWCWYMPMYDVAYEALAAAYHEFRVPLDLPVPLLYLLSRGSDFTLLWVFDHFEGGSHEDLPKIVRLIARLADFSQAAAEGVTLDLLDTDREAMIALVRAPVPRVTEYLKAHGTECRPVGDDDDA